MCLCFAGLLCSLFLRCLKKTLNCELWKSGEWWLHHDNAPTQTALDARQSLTKNGMTPTYSPSLFTLSCFLQLLFVPLNEKVFKGKQQSNLSKLLYLFWKGIHWNNLVQDGQYTMHHNISNGNRDKSLSLTWCRIN